MKLHRRKRRAPARPSRGARPFPAWVVLAAIACLGLPLQALRAQEPAGADAAGDRGLLYGLRLGVLAHDVDHLWSRSRAESGVDLNLEIVFGRPGWALWGGTVLSQLGASLNSEGKTSKAYGGLLWERIFGGGLFCNTGLGLALHDGRLESDDPNRKELGSRLLFRIPFEAGFGFGGRHRLSLFFDHVSNGYLARPNEGLDTLGVRYGIQF